MNLNRHILNCYVTFGGREYKQLPTSYEIIGKVLHTAPIVLVNHALTGNSDVASTKKGWWKGIIGDGKLIDTHRYTVFSFNIIGNGYDGNLFDNYKDFTAKDIARIFYLVLKELKIDKVYAIIGGSLGGGIAWEMASLYPDFSKYLIPIASDLKSSDWVIGHNSIQESILLNSKKPLQDARKMAMLFYRTPASFAKKFGRTRTGDSEMFNVESWLNYHGNKLESRFELKAYLMMNHLLTTIDISNETKSIEEILVSIKSIVIQIAVDSDLFFVRDEIIKTKILLDTLNVPNEYHEIKSEDGHDAFLIEYEQTNNFLNTVFNQK